MDPFDVISVVIAGIAAVVSIYAARAAKLSALAANNFALSIEGELRGSDRVVVQVTNLGPAICHGCTIKLVDIDTGDVLHSHEIQTTLGPGGKSVPKDFSGFAHRKHLMQVHWQDPNNEDQSAERLEAWPNGARKIIG